MLDMFNMIIYIINIKTIEEEKMKKIITWTTGDGREAGVVVELITSKVLNADGDKITVHCCEMEIKATINGKMVGYGYPQTVNHPVAVAKIGTLGIAADNMAKIAAAIDEIKATPEWVEKERRAAQNEKASREYDEHYRKIARAMAE